MARSIVCDVCGAVQGGPQAHRWRKLQLFVGTVKGGDPVEGDPNDKGTDVCGGRCAAVWAVRLIRHLFR